MTAPAILRRWAGPRPGSLVVAAIRERLLRLRGLARWGAALLTALVGHVAVTQHLAVGGVPPDGLLVAVVAVAAARGVRAGASFGFAAGLGADLSLSTPLGTSALAYTLLGHCLGRSQALGTHTADRPGSMMRRSLLLTFIGVGTGRLAVAVLGTALGGSPFPQPPGLFEIAAVAGVSALLGPPAFTAAGRWAPSPASRP